MRFGVVRIGVPGVEPWDSLGVLSAELGAIIGKVSPLLDEFKLDIGEDGGVPCFSAAT